MMLVNYKNVCRLPIYNIRSHSVTSFFPVTQGPTQGVCLPLVPSKWVHILRSVITVGLPVIQFPAPQVWSILNHCWIWMSLETFGLKIIGYYGDLGL